MYLFRPVIASYARYPENFPFAYAEGFSYFKGNCWPSARQCSIHESKNLRDRLERIFEAPYGSVAQTE
jgi:hypothetical protein